MNYNWNPTTLRFYDPQVEEDFWNSEVTYSIGAVRLLAFFAGGAGLAESLFRAMFLEESLSFFRICTLIIFATIILVGKFYGFRHRAKKMRHKIGFFFFTSMVFTIFLLPYIAPPHLVSGLFFYAVVLQIFNLLMPYSQVVKLWVNVLTIGAFCFQHAIFPLLEPALFETIILPMAMAGGAASIMAYLDERNRRSSFVLKRNLASEKNRSETLLANTLPESIANQLKNNNPGEKIAVECSDTVVLFADIVGFTELSGRLDPHEVVRILDDLFSRFDAIMDIHGLEKIKTIGDAYMAAAGVPVFIADPLEPVAEAALDILSAVERYCNISGLSLRVRIGFHSGSVVAGVIGRKRFLFDLWGQTVNIAARLESTTQPGTIQITASVGKLLATYGFGTRAVGMVELKGIGTIETCHLLPRAINA